MIGAKRTRLHRITATPTQPFAIAAADTRSHGHDPVSLQRGQHGAKALAALAWLLPRGLARQSGGRARSRRLAKVSTGWDRGAMGRGTGSRDGLGLEGRPRGSGDRPAGRPHAAQGCPQGRAICARAVLPVLHGAGATG